MKLVLPSAEILMSLTPIKMMKLVERIAKKCYQSEHSITDGSYEKFILKIIDNGHHSTIEHLNFTVDFVNDRGVSHEQVRHRLCAFSQESTRYCNYSKDKFGNEITVIPPFFFNPFEESKDVSFPISYKTINFDLNPVKLNSFDVWFLSCLWSEWGYTTLLKTFKRSPQEARSVLPNSLKTSIAVTANLREWRHIFNLRALGTAGTPHPQMRQVMLPVLRKCADYLPLIFGDIFEESVNRGLYKDDYGACDVDLTTL